MIKRIDFQYPDLIEELLNRHNRNIRETAKAVHIHDSFFRKIRNGQTQFTEPMQERFRQALAAPATSEKEPKPMSVTSAPSEVAETCPPLLAELIKKSGTKKAAALLLGASDGTFYAVYQGRREMPPEWIVRIKAELGIPIIPFEQIEPEEGAASETFAPPFEKWDGKAKGMVYIKGRGGKKGYNIKNVPKPLVDVFEKCDGSVTKTVAALGSSFSSVLEMMKGNIPFNERMQRKAHDVLHGVALVEDTSMGVEYDKYSLGMAICLLKSSNFDRINDVAAILNGRLVFKKSTSSGWLIIYKMAVDDLPKFKRLALRDATEIVCP